MIKKVCLSGCKNRQILEQSQLDGVQCCGQAIETVDNIVSSKKNSSKQGLRQGWTRVTFILKEAHVEKLKSLAYWERISIKEIVDDALSSYLEKKVK